jgi:hypothetical protein
MTSLPSRRHVEGRQAVAGLYRAYGDLIVLDRCHDLAVHLSGGLRTRGQAARLHRHRLTGRSGAEAGVVAFCDPGTAALDDACSRLIDVAGACAEPSKPNSSSRDAQIRTGTLLQSMGADSNTDRAVSPVLWASGDLLEELVGRSDCGDVAGRRWP